MDLKSFVSPISQWNALYPSVVRRYAKKGTDSGGRWITMGAKEGSDGKKHGGSRVFIKNGRIEKGHPSLHGKKIGALKEESTATNRQELHAGKGHAKATWAKKAKKEGLNPQHLHQLAHEMLSHDKAYKADHHAMLKEARRGLREFGGDWKNIKQRAATGQLEEGDAIRGMDEVAETMAQTYPHLFEGHGNSDDRLFDLLSAGNPEQMSEDEAYEHAFGHLMDDKPHPDEDEERGEGIAEEGDADFDFGANVDPLQEVPVGELRTVDGFKVRRTGKDDYRIEKEGGSGVVRGDSGKIREYIDRELKSQKAYGRQLPEALARAEAYTEPNFMDTAGQRRAAEGFANLKAGTPVVSLEEETKGRTGRIVRDETGKNRVKLDGEDGFSSNFVEPLDAKLSWRKSADQMAAEEAERPKQTAFFQRKRVALWRMSQHCKVKS